MPDKTQDARGRRSEARERRRARGAEPPEELEPTASPEGSDSPSEENGNAGGTAAKMVGTALAAGLLGVLGGAVKAALARREKDSPPTDDGEPRSEPERESEADEPVDASSDESQPEPERESEPGEPVDVPSRESQPESEEAQEVEQPEASASHDEPRRDTEERGLSEDETAGVVGTARRRLEALLDTNVERVSGLERVDGRWSVLLDVVEVARIPESTDVLATYEVVVNDDGGLAGVSRVRRYRRSQLEEEA
jgi:hypothetical protein